MPITSELNSESSISDQTNTSQSETADTTSVDVQPSAASNTHPEASGTSSKPSVAPKTSGIPTASKATSKVSPPSTTSKTPSTPAQYPVPKRPNFYLDDYFTYVASNKGEVTFKPDRYLDVGVHTGFKLYFTNDDGNPDIMTFNDNGFNYNEILGYTVDIKVTCVNHTAESEPYSVRFAMLDKVKASTIWSQPKSGNMDFGEQCWYGVTWSALNGAAGYNVYLSNSSVEYGKYVNSGDLRGFFKKSVSTPSFSTKVSSNTTGLPDEIINASLFSGVTKYIVIKPFNNDGVEGPFARYYKIELTGGSIKPVS